MFAWLRRLLNAVGKITAQPQGLDETRVDNQVGEEVVRNRRKVPAKKSNTGTKPARIRSNNKSKASGKSTGKAVRATTSKSKIKSKTVQKG